MLSPRAIIDWEDNSRLCCSTLDIEVIGTCRKDTICCKVESTINVTNKLPHISNSTLQLLHSTFLLLHFPSRPDDRQIMYSETSSLPSITTSTEVFTTFWTWNNDIFQSVSIVTSIKEQVQCFTTPSMIYRKK